MRLYHINMEQLEKEGATMHEQFFVMMKCMTKEQLEKLRSFLIYQSKTADSSKPLAADRGLEP